MNDENILKIAGIDAEKFLQGQLTINVSLLKPGTLQLAAHCNPQGRIISLGYLTIYENDYYFLIPDDMQQIAANALKKYAVFFKVSLSTVPSAQLPIKPPTTLEKMTAGIPSIYAKTSGLFLPHELNLHLLNAIDFDKGCYTGQEIIARMHYRGKLKKHLYRAEYTSTTPPMPGSEITNANATIVDAIEVGASKHLILLVCDESDAKNQQLSEDNKHDLHLLD